MWKLNFIGNCVDGSVNDSLNDDLYFCILDTLDLLVFAQLLGPLSLLVQTINSTGLAVIFFSNQNKDKQYYLL